LFSFFVLVLRSLDSGENENDYENESIRAAQPFFRPQSEKKVVVLCHLP